MKVHVYMALATLGGLLALYGEAPVSLWALVLFVPAAFRALALAGPEAVRAATPHTLLALGVSALLEGRGAALAVLAVFLSASWFAEEFRRLRPKGEAG